MLRINVLDDLVDRLLLLEGKLMSVWVEELRKAWREARLGLQNRAITVDVNGLTFVSGDGQKLLFEMMTDGAKFQGGGVYIRHLIDELEIQANKSKDLLVEPQQLP